MGWKDILGSLSKIKPSTRSNLKWNDFDPYLLCAGLEQVDRCIFIMEVKNDQFVYQYANEAALKLIHQDETIIGNSFMDVLSPSSADFLSKQYKKAIDLNENIVFKDEMELYSGEKIIHETTLKPFIHRGSTYVIAIIHDITEEKLEIERLQRSKENEQRLASLVEKNQNAVYLLNTNGYFLEVNDATEMITGYNGHNLIGRHYTEFFAGHDNAKAKRKFQLVLQGKTVNYETIIYHKNGHELILSVTQIPIIVDDEIVGIYVIARDITLDKTEQYRAMSEKRQFDQFFESNPYAIVLLDRNSRVVFANKSYTDLYGFTEEEVIGRALPTIPDWLLSDAEEIHEQVITGTQLVSLDYKRQKKTGELIDINASVFGVRDDEGHITSIAVIEKDYSEWKKEEIEAEKGKLLFEHVWGNSPDGICLIGSKGEILRVNPQFEEMFGFKWEEIVQKPFASIQPSHLRDQVHSLLASLQESGKAIRSSTKQQKADGSLLDVEVVYQPLKVQEHLVLVRYKDMTKSVQKLEELKASEEMYRTLVEKSPEAIAVYQNGFIRYMNPKGLEILRASSPIEVLNQEIQTFKLHEDVGDEQRAYSSLVIEKNFVRFDGSTFIGKLEKVPIKLSNEPCTLFTFQDVTGKRMAEKAMLESEERFRIIAENTSNIIKLLDDKGIVTYVSPALEEILGYPVRDFIGESYQKFMHEEDKEQVEKQFRAMLKSKEEQEIEARRIHIDGYSIWLHSSLVPILDTDGEIEKVVVISRDITENKQREKKLSKLAFYDALTGLPNRRLFKDRFQQATFTTDRTGKLTALMVLDCDSFKSINDNLGHDIGDEVIKEFAKRVNLGLRKTDTLSRLGGDEFIVVLPEVGNEQDIVDISERILENIRMPMKIKDAELHVTASIGIAFYPKDGPDYEEVFKKADSNLYKAKELGKDTFVL